MLQECYIVSRSLDELEEMYDHLWAMEIDSVYDCLTVSSIEQVLHRAELANCEFIKDDHLMECPGEAHIKDMCFNPGSQGPYGDGAHSCDLCDNEGEITFLIYKRWARDVRSHIKSVEERRIRLAEEKEQAKLVDAIMKLPQANVPNVNK